MVLSVTLYSGRLCSDEVRQNCFGTQGCSRLSYGEECLGRIAALRSVAVR